MNVVNPPNDGHDLNCGPELTVLKGVGKSTAERLGKLGIYSVIDLLFHLPLRYQDRSSVAAIAGLVPGSEAVVHGTVVSSVIQFGKRRSLLVTIKDDTGILKLRFFHFSMNQKAGFVEGKCISCFGEVRQTGTRTTRHGLLEMAHPEYRVGDQHFQFSDENKLTPVYPLTDGLQQRSMRSLVEQAFSYVEKSGVLLEDLLPEQMLQEYGMGPLINALEFIHYPTNDISVNQLASGTHPFQQRLVFEELLARHLCLRQLRSKLHKKNAVSICRRDDITPLIDSCIPFALTNAQKNCIDEVMCDLEKSHPMQRLVQGDVGCGKTMVAVYSAFHVASQSYQVAIMAPTEILAEQHYVNFYKFGENLGIDVVCLTGKIKGTARKMLLEKIASGKARIVIGTHALFQDDIEFKNLVYVVVDEQHRFGVLQRLKLIKKGISDGSSGATFPHQLIMSATPIPRSLAMSLYADLDCSVIDEMPPGRIPVNSVAIAEERRNEVLGRVYHACKQGQQAYWVCPLIEESETLQCQAAVDTAVNIDKALPELNIGLVHGRMKPAEKEAIMTEFKNGVLDILVATTVIEVGIDVPNASVMVIENSERLGLSQLHQLRGRIGRGGQSSSCIFMYSAPLTHVATKRLSVMRQTNDGFEIARQDMTMRGPGEVLGTQQTGLMQFRIADLPRDEYLLPKVSQAAEHMLEKFPAASQSIINRWIGYSARYWEA